MAKKRKIKKKKIEKTYYEIEVEDWEVTCRFGLNTLPTDLHDGVYWEHSSLILTGKILSPVLEKAGKARIKIADEPQMDDHWKTNPTIMSAEAIGFMEIPRGDDTLILYCSIPSRSFPFLALSVDSGKIKFATVFGTILKWRRGTITSVSFSKHREEE